MASQAPAKSSLFYLYIGSEWSGPFQVEQIRFFRHHGQVESDTYAYDPDQQRHYTVGELLAAIDASPAASPNDLLGEDNPLVPQELDEAATPSTTRIFLASEESEATATLGTSLDALPDPLRTLHSAYRELTEGRPADREQVIAHLDETASSIGIQLSAAANDPESLTLLVGDLLRLSDYLANRHQDNELWEAVDALRSLKPETDTDDCILAGRQVVSLLVTKARAGRIKRTDRHTPGLLPTVEPQPAARSTIRDVHPEGALQLTDTGVHKPASESWHQPHARTARMIMRDARKELRSTEADLEAIQQAYGQLQEQHTRDLTEAQEMLATLEYSRADEAANAAQALAEVRSLAAEIHRLAEENLSSEPDLQADIRNLADELKGQDATAMAPLAEGLLIRLVARLRNLTATGELSVDVGKDVVALREELAKARSDLVQARAQAMVLSDERDRLRRQLDEQRGAADRAIASAKEREQRLRSTVTALEVTKDLHQDVMRELDVQLQTAQRRVGEMESELSVVRGELVNTRSNLAERTRELQDEMRRAVELQAMLEARRAELSVNLKDAEAQLLQAQTDQATPGATSDPELMEALAVKVNHLRTMFEATKRRLDEQQQLAAKLEEDLATSRREAIDLRSRSDSLTGELDEARVGLASAKKRFEELHRANARLEAERESLQLELVTRKGTDTLRRERDPLSESGNHDKPTESNRQSGTNRLTKAIEQLETKLSDTNRRLEQANAQLDNERRRVVEITETQSQLQVRVEDLTADRDQLRAELDRLHADHFADHSRHAASFASATQGTIDAERRLKEATLRVVELEGQVAFLQQHQQAPDAALQQLDAEGEERQSGAHFIPSAQVADLSRQLDEARTELAALKAGNADALATEQRAALAARLVQVESDLTSATASRDDAGSQLKAAVAERDRFSRELLRLKNEHESAAVEHRVSLKSARDKLAESQARVVLLEKELDQHRGGEVKSRELTVERDRLNEEVRSLSVRIERTQVSAELPEVKRQLEKEQERIRTLTRSLSDAQEQADTARSKVIEMEARSGSAHHERDQLHIEIERLKGELLAAQAQAGNTRGHDADHREHFDRRLQDVLTDREQLLSELSRVNGELMQVRGRLVRAESEAITAERLPRERNALFDLERQLAQLRAESQTNAAQLAEMRTRLGQVTSERDHLQEEVNRLRQQLASFGGANILAELGTLRDKLTRAKQRIRTLRKERDELLERVTAMPVDTRAVTLAQPFPGMTTSGARPAVGQPPAPPAFTPSTTAPAHAGAQEEDPAFISAYARGAVGDGEPLERKVGGGSRPGRSPAGGFTSRLERPRLPPVTRALGRAGDTGIRLGLAAHRDGPESPWLMPSLLGSGAVAVAVGLSVLWLYGTPVKTVHAWVNAKVVTIQAPIEGRVTRNGAVLRASAAAGTAMVSLANPDPDRSEVERIKEEIRDIDARLSALRVEREGIQHRPLMLLPGSPMTAPAASAASLVLPPLMTDEAPLAPASGVEAIDQQLADLSRQRELAQAKQVAAEEHLRSMRAAEVSLPVEGVVMRSLAAEGRWVRVGDPLLAVADRSTLMLDAIFDSSAKGRIKVGDQVAVALGDDVRVVTATVTEIIAVDAAVPTNSVVDLGPLPAGGLCVRITLPVDPAQHISIGQPARVMVTGPDLPLGTRIGVGLNRCFWL